MRDDEWFDEDTEVKYTPRPKSPQMTTDEMVRMIRELRFEFERAGILRNAA